MKRISEIFRICYGSQLDLNKCEICCKTEGYNFVNRSSTNCGVSAQILKVANKEPFKAGSITVAMGGSVLSSFVQQEDFYTGQNVKVLVPLEEMSLSEKLYYCQCIEANRFRFSTFGREANYSFDSLLIPSREQIPNEILQREINTFINPAPVSTKKLELHTEKWMWFEVGKVFDVGLTKGDIKADRIDMGSIPLISSGETNNGIVKYVDENGDGIAEIIDSNTITLDMFCHAYYHAKPYYAVGHGRVNILKPKFKMNKYSGLFICLMMDLERYRFSYGRAVYSSVAKEMRIKLPTIQTADGEYEPDWQFMEDYIKSLPYSSCL